MTKIIIESDTKTVLTEGLYIIKDIGNNNGIAIVHPKDGSLFFTCMFGNVSVNSAEVEILHLTNEEFDIQKYQIVKRVDEIIVK